jgi:hypothetical protein
MVKSAENAIIVGEGGVNVLMMPLDEKTTYILYTFSSYDPYTCVASAASGCPRPGVDARPDLTLLVVRIWN